MRKRSLLFSLFTLAACGGGGSSNTTDPSLGAGAADPTQPAGGAPGAASAGAPTPAGTASGSGSSTGGAAPAAPRGHQRCGWIGPGDTAGAQTFAAHAEWFDAIHPDWYALNADGVSVRALQGADDPTVVQAAQAHHVVLMPLIAAVEDPSYVRNMIAGAATRSQLEQALVQLATQHGYDGVDIDFEHLWQASDRPGFSAFMTELAQALHAAGKRLSIAMPAQVDD